uniref:Gypsy retrotransposon integrase-like protein 1 n=1 Tax=Salarias fasciatus TaxID=181472 RepID=A0A672IAI9_SALFA
MPDASSPSAFATASPPDQFDVTKNISLVPPFRESEVDSYFGVFECIAAALKWPEEMWPLLLHYKLTGKAQEVVSALSLEDSLKYDKVKATVLRAYELVPEAYRQGFRQHKKATNQTFVEFAREKEQLYDRWLQASKVTDFASLRELNLLEEFKSCVPEKFVVYCNEQKVTTLSQAAVLADEFALTHKTVFTAPRVETRRVVSPPVQSGPSQVASGSKGTGARECFYCHKVGHLIQDCRKHFQVEKRSPSSPNGKKPVVLVKTKPVAREVSGGCADSPDPSYAPFIFPGSVSLCDSSEEVPIHILRDTGAAQSVILVDVLPWSEASSCGYSLLLQGIEMGHVPVPLHSVKLRSKLISDQFKVALQHSLPVKGVSLIMGNDIAGGLVSPVIEVFAPPNKPMCLDTLGEDFPSAFPACVFTRAQSRRLGEEVCGLEDTVLCPLFQSAENVSPSSPVKNQDSVKQVKSLTDELVLPVTGDTLRKAQKQDPSLTNCVSAAVSSEEASTKKVAYVLEDGLLLRTWMPRKDTDKVLDSVKQVVVPKPFRAQVLALAHDSPWSGHLGVTKTYDRILKHFFWPGLKKDVATHCRTCHTCQIVGKPNQVVSPAPLCPIPVMAEPFERVIVDCVGPLPRTKAGNQFLITIMCTATRFPEAIPVCKITAKVVIALLTKFFSTFGLPKIVQTDQGSNFLSKLFSQVLKTLNITHKVSSAYHPQSQGALERWHQTLKSTLRKYCLDTSKDWDEGIPFVLFGLRETVQESLKFSPAELVFGHTVRGPLKVLKERMISTDPAPRSVLDYVSKVRERLHHACALAKEVLSSSQETMKTRYDKTAVPRALQPGDSFGAVASPWFCPVCPLQWSIYGGEKTQRHGLCETDARPETSDQSVSY